MSVEGNLLVVLAMVLPGCITIGDDSGATGGGGGGGSGSLTVDGETCTIDEGPSWGYCLDGESAFSVDGSGDCGGVHWRATAWLPPDALTTLGTFTLLPDHGDAGSDIGTVWVDVGDETWTTTSGSLTLSGSDGQVVTATFDAELEDFIGGDPGPSASGTMKCEG
jgi:hypothetical protein